MPIPTLDQTQSAVSHGWSEPTVQSLHVPASQQLTRLAWCLAAPPEGLLTKRAAALGFCHTYPVPLSARVAAGI